MAVTADGDGRERGRDAPERDTLPLPPTNAEAEQALLGAILINNGAHGRVAEVLRAEHFSSPVHGRIYAAIGKLIERGQVANPITLKNLFERDGALEQVGGVQYLARLAASAVTVLNAKSYADTIVDLAMRRSLMTLCLSILEGAGTPSADESAFTLIDNLEASLMSIQDAQLPSERGFVAIGDAAQDQLRATEEARKNRLENRRVAWAETGFVDLDHKLVSLEPGDFYVLAGRPSMGKSALAVAVGMNVAKAEGRPVAMFDLEGSAGATARRQLSILSGVSVRRQRSGEIDQMQFEMNRLVSAAGELRLMPFYIDDTPGMTLARLRTRARRLKRQLGGLGLVIVDYLQLMAPGETKRGGGGNRVQEISEITRGLKLIAKELEVPILALSQLSRQVEARDDKRPMLQDLRESGSIEQDADVVLFVFREQYYLERSEPGRRDGETDEKFNNRYEAWRNRCAEMFGIAEVIIGKQRLGPVGTVRLHFDGETGQFGNHAGAERLPVSEY